MNAAFLGSLILMVAGGMAIAVQAPINAALGRSLNDTLSAALVSVTVSTACLAALIVVRGGGSTLLRVGTIPWWCWLGGFLGAFFVWAALSGVTRLGAVTMVAAIVLGQMTAALVIDATGAFGLQVQSIGWQRILAVVMVAGGLLLSKLWFCPIWKIGKRISAPGLATSRRSHLKHDSTMTI